MIKDKVERVIQHISKIEPNVQSFVLPGLSQEAIIHIERKYLISLPQAVRDLYGVVNGATNQNRNGNYAAITFPALAGYLMPSLEAALDDRLYFLQKEIIPNYSPDWLPIFDDGFANYLLADLSSDGVRIAEYNAEHWENFDDAVMFPSLGGMFDYLNELFVRGCFIIDEEGQIQENQTAAINTAVGMFDILYWREEKLRIP